MADGLAMQYAASAETNHLPAHVVFITLAINYMWHITSTNF